ncbi:MAG: C45 family peptidase [Gemmatimonadota bacterium]|nr:C45 family peptidase [Gemmatimonadota bacterium]
MDLRVKCFLQWSILVFILVARPLAAASELTTLEKKWLSRASRTEQEGWIFLHLEGKPFERGFQHGYLLAPEIKKAIGIDRHLIYWQTPKDFDFFVSAGMRLFDDGLDSELKEELEGLAAGLEKAGIEGIGYPELLVHNSIHELLWYWWPWVEKDLPARLPPDRADGCSAFIATGSSTADSGIVMAHNTWTNYAFASFRNVIMDLLPEKGHRIIMHTSAGFIHSGSDFFVCASGLIGTETTIGDFTHEYDTTGTAEFSRVRRAMQYAGTIDEWAQIMIENNSGGYANSWLLGDVRSGEIARLELGCRYHRLEKKTDGFFIGSNIAEDRDILLNETETNFSDIRKSNVARRVSWKRLMNRYGGRLDAGLAREMLADHYDSYLGRENPGPRSICGHGELADGITNPTTGTPFYPSGAIDGKVVDTQMARRMSLWARWGSSCGKPFLAGRFIDSHPQFEWLRGFMDDRPTREWTVFEKVD